MNILKLENNYSWFLSKDEEVKNVLWKALRFRERGYYHNLRFKMKLWDGYTDFFKKDTGRFLTGLLPEIKVALKYLGILYEVVDNRGNFEFLYDEIDENFLYPVTLRDYQVDYINQALKNHRGIIPSPTGSGKAQPLDSIVYTPNGPKKMGEIQQGDDVCTPDGGTSKVLAVYPQGEIDVYVIKFNNGDEVECCGEHLWKVDSVYNGWKDRVLSTLEMNNYKCALKNTSTVLFKRRDVDIDPYVLGCLLGDGGISCTDIIFTCANKFIKSRFESRLVDGYVLKLNSRDDYRLVKTLRGEYRNCYKSALRRYGLWGHKSKNKFIPDDYLFNSYEVRLELLRGLLDTDGCVDKNSSVYFYTTSKQLRDGIKLLIESLGGICRLTEKETYCKKNGVYVKCNNCFNVCINICNSKDLFTVPYKQERCRDFTSCCRRVVNSIELIGKKQCQCILIDHPEHLYLTNNFVPTHNTLTMIGILKSLPPNTPTLILTNKKQLVEQSYDEIKKFNIEHVGKFHGDTKEPNMITCSTVQSAHLLEPLLPKIKVLIVDEIHEMMSRKPKKIYNRLKNACVRIGMSATAFKFGGTDKGQKYEVKGWIGPMFVSHCTEDGKITTKELQERGVLSQSNCIFYPIRKPPLPYDVYLDAVTRGIAENSYFNEIVSKLATSQKGRTLVLVERISHGDTLQQMMPGALWVQGKDDIDTRKEVINKLKESKDNVIAIATQQIFNTGVNCYLHSLINAAGGQADHTIIQRIGRGLRTADDKEILSYYDFIFEINYYLLKHSKKRIRVIKSCGHNVEIKEIDFETN